MGLGVGWLIGSMVASTLFSNKKNRDAEKDAKKDALKDRRRADEEELFSKTEGEGLGQLGTISLDVDDEEEDDELKSTISI